MLRLSLSLIVASTLACTAEQAVPPPATPAKTNKPIEVSTAPPIHELPELLTDPSDKALPPKDGFFMAEGAPEPQACAVASDCLGDTIPDVDNPCCQNPVTLEPYSRAYRKWIAQWRGGHCDGITCPPPPPPSMPPDCAFAVECVDGRCVDTCG